MAERFNAAVLKTVDCKVRGFESLSVRQLSFSPSPLWGFSLQVADHDKDCRERDRVGGKPKWMFRGIKHLKSEQESA